MNELLNNIYTVGIYHIIILEQAVQREAATKAVLVQDYEQQLAELREENARLQSANDALQADVMLQFADKSICEQEVDKWK